MCVLFASETLKVLVRHQGWTPFMPIPENIFQLISKCNACYLQYFKKTHTHPFNGPLSSTTRVGRYQKGKTKLNFTEARDSE